MLLPLRVRAATHLLSEFLYGRVWVPLFHALFTPLDSAQYYKETMDYPID